MSQPVKISNNDAKEVIECSTIYDIDFASIIFSIALDQEVEYVIFLNDQAEVSANFRKYIPRLALPFFLWEVDPQKTLKQLHAPIDNITTYSYLQALKMVMDSYGPIGGHKLSQVRARFYDSIVDESKKCSDNSLVLYMHTIERLIETVTGRKVKISAFGSIRNGFTYQQMDIAVDCYCNSFEQLPDGEYKFHKGGSIDILMDGKWVQFKKIIKLPNQIFLENPIGNKIKLDFIKSGNLIRVRGPIEVELLCSFGKLIDLPWYSKAMLTHDVNSYHKGIEYISPISVSTSNRLSQEAGGHGMRLYPSGYSLIEYNHDAVIAALKCLYDKNEVITFGDLAGWQLLINNYPLSNQKISKSQTQVHRYCDNLIVKRYKMVLSGDNSFLLFHYKNYILLGDNLISIICCLRIVREFLNLKSPYYLDLNHLNRSSLFDDDLNCRQLYRFIDLCYSKTRSVILHFTKDASLFTEDKVIENFMLKSNISLNCCDKIFVSSVATRLERFFTTLLMKYYEIVAFVSGALLKANIFTAFNILGTDYIDQVRKILDRRDKKVLYFIPEYFSE